MAAFESIATVTGTSATTTITFSSIPQTFKDLWIVATWNSNNANNYLNTYFNGDSNGSNYAFIQGYSTDQTPVSDASTANFRGPVYGNSASYYITSWIRIGSYSSTQTHNAHWIAGGFNVQGQGNVGYRGTGAISSITFSAANANSITNYKFSLFGVGL